MKSLIKNAVMLSVYHIARITVVNMEAQMKEDDKNEIDNAATRTKNYYI